MPRSDRATSWQHPSNPRLPAPLIGRQSELVAARDLLARGARLLTLTGPPGVGKTSLALALAGQRMDQFAHGAVLVDLSEVVDADLVAPTMADLLGATGRRRDPVARLIAALQRLELLLVLDNFEQAVDEALATLGPGIEASPDPDDASRPVMPRDTTGSASGPGRSERQSSTASLPLSRRERDVAALLARGSTNRQIADLLVVSEGTAANYVQRVMNCLGLHNRVQVAAWAVERRLHEVPSSRDVLP